MKNILDWIPVFGIIPALSDIVNKDMSWILINGAYQGVCVGITISALLGYTIL